VQAFYLNSKTPDAMRIVAPFIMIILMLVSVSCGDSSVTRTLPNISGASGSVLVVMDRDLWNGAPGEAVRSELAAFLNGMPQPEPAFDLLHVTPETFRDIYLVQRNIVFTSIDRNVTEASVTSVRDRWAETQLVTTITAPDTASLVSIVKEKSQTIRKLINDIERERLTSWLINSAGTNRAAVRAGTKELGIFIPAGYKVDIEREGLLMISAETPHTTQSVIISTGESAASRIGCIELANMTEKITSAEVRGPDGGSFMAIEKSIPVTCSSFRRNNTDYIEMRGLWTLEGGFMGGPFVTYAYIDTVALRTVVVTGFVYAPREKKRELLRQVEALMYSIN